jgi:tetratricopeptide (TPR) repeat protein
MLGEYEQARNKAQIGLVLTQERGYHLGIAASLATLGQVAIAENKYDQAQQLAQQLHCAFEHTGVQSWALLILGHAACALGHYDQAKQHICKALRMRAESWGLSDRVWAVSTIALLLTGDEKVEQAVELYALASRYPMVANAPFFEDTVGQHIAAAAEALPPEVVAAAQARGQARDLEATVRELLEEMESDISASPPEANAQE